MSEPENFLSRWSRRKLEAEQNEDARPDEAASPPAPADEASPPAEVLAKPDAKEGREEKEEPAFDIATLPSLESITAETDIRLFLQKGVPTDLTRAALRRAWTADPNIRDFIGIAENQWDFATGSDLPGFGSLDATPEDLRRMVAEVFGDIRPPADEPKPAAAKADSKAETPTESEANEPAAQPLQLQQEVATAQAEPAPEAAPTGPPESNVQRNKVDIASQQSNEGSEYEPLPARRPHGRALPQ